MNNKKDVVVIGAGLCGSLLATRLAQLGFPVTVYERRGDMRRQSMSAGRSINLALSQRGFKGLGLVGADERIRNICIPMHGRMIHGVDGSLKYLPYSGRSGFFINSVSRGGLNSLLLDELDGFANARVHFQHRCDHVDLDSGNCVFTEEFTGNQKQHNADIVIGTDGAGSALRQAYYSRSNAMRFNFSQQYLSHGYKELEIPSDGNGGYLMEKNALHIWPRGSQMLIALPNLDGSFTVTLFQTFSGDEGLDALDADPEKARSFFQKYYPDALQLMPDFEHDFQTNPSSSLATIKCDPWNAGDRFLLLGDAAHAVVPFYGQGMNCAFEDVFELDAILSEENMDFSRTIPRVASSRKPNADAIADLAVDNFYEMRDHSGNPVFQRKSALENRLEHHFEDYYSKYSMVTFRADLPYRTAMIKGRLQDAFLMEYCAGIEDVTDVNLEEVKAGIDAYVATHLLDLTL
jgi:kynurenine 3-monooxygenase